MTARTLIAIAALWALSLFGVAQWTFAQGATQGGPNPILTGGRIVETNPPTITQPPSVFSDTDIGFRVERQDATKAVGRLVVRINGQWIDAEIPR